MFKFDAAYQEPIIRRMVKKKVLQNSENGRRGFIICLLNIGTMSSIQINSWFQTVNLFPLHTQEIWRLKQECFIQLVNIDRCVNNLRGDMVWELSRDV